ncbi:MAG: SRPBCC domain-containing protein [Chloroflexota bacterium]
MDQGTDAQGESISFDFDLPHAPEKVWRALTEPDLLAEWLLPAIGLKLEPGAAFTLRAPPRPGWDGTIYCRFITIEPGQRLTCSWDVGDLNTIVTFILSPQPSGTRLSVVQSGFRADQRQNIAGARYGWNMMGGKLADLLDRLS